MRIPPRRTFGNSRDPAFQGDGWRWALFLYSPDWLLFRTTGWINSMVPVGSPVTLGMLVLTRDQRMACHAEWYATQLGYRGRP